MYETLKAKLGAYYNRFISAAYYKASSWLVNVFAILVAAGPDLVNMVLQNTDLIGSALPTLSVAHKAQFLLGANVLAAVFRMLRQKSVTKAQVTQAAYNGEIITRVGSSSLLVSVPGTAAQVVLAADQLPPAASPASPVPIAAADFPDSMSPDDILAEQRIADLERQSKDPSTHQ